MIQLIIQTPRETRTITLEEPANLRRVLLEHGLSPYSTATQKLNCGGRGLCATCGVLVEGTAPARHWHDRLADRFGYPRLACQIWVDRDLTVQLLPGKLIWGSAYRKRG